MKNWKPNSSDWLVKNRQSPSHIHCLRSVYINVYYNQYQCDDPTEDLIFNILPRVEWQGLFDQEQSTGRPSIRPILASNLSVVAVLS